MAWRLAKSLDTLRKQINSAYADRSKASDGTIGDAAHASRSSDHNPWVKDGKTGIVTAIDFTHDPAKGLDAGVLADALVASRDSRIKYVIWNRRIISGAGGTSPWKWRKYAGSNPHNKHVHLSVKSRKASYDDTSLWDIGLQAKVAKVDDMPPPPDVVPVPEKAEADFGSKLWGWCKSWKTWLPAGGLGLGGLADYRIWIVLAFLIVVVGGVVWFTYLLPKLRERRRK
jgi:hypothetical protein